MGASGRKHSGPIDPTSATPDQFQKRKKDGGISTVKTSRNTKYQSESRAFLNERDM